MQQLLMVRVMAEEARFPAQVIFAGKAGKTERRKRVNLARPHVQCSHLCP